MNDVTLKLVYIYDSRIQKHNIGGTFVDDTFIKKFP